jgi:hypothetical protein
VSALSLDQQAREYRRLREARRRSIVAALVISPALLLTDRTGTETIAIVSPDVQDPTQERVTFIDGRGPRGHATRATRAAIVERIVEEHAASVRAMTEDEVMAWTTEARP